MTLNDKGYLPLVNRKYTPSSKSGFTYSLFFFSVSGVSLAYFSCWGWNLLFSVSS